MDFGLTKEEQVFSKEVKEFLAKELTTDAVDEWNRGLGFGPKCWAFLGKLGAKGWLASMLPKEYGGTGGTWMQRAIIENTLAYNLFPSPLMLVGVGIAIPMLMAVGTEEQKREYIPQIAGGKVEFALGYSEPEAGSDLSNIDIRAVEEGDYYVINGQKTYNTCCHYAQYHWLCARTEVTTPKHRGLSLFVVPLNSPGISLNPLWVIGGERTNQVFYDNVRVPKKNLVGEKNRGFYHMMTALALERMFPTGQLRRAFDEIKKYAQTTSKNGKLLSQDPIVRQKLAELDTRLQIAEILGHRLIWMLQHEQTPDWQAPLSKIFVTELEQDMAYNGLRIMGLYGPLETGSKYAPIHGHLAHFFLSVARRTISGGTNEIQRNIIAQRGFGLPRA